MDLSVIIPALNEEFLQKTIDSVLSESVVNTEVIVIFDGYWPNPGIIDNERVKIIHNYKPVGQRAAINQGAMLSQAKYIMKLDAHCSLGHGFDKILIDDCCPDWTVVPRMYVLDAFHWVCLACGMETDQGPIPVSCGCGNSCFEKKIVWEPKYKKCSDYMFFDRDLKFSYFDSNHIPQLDREKKRRYNHKYRGWAKGDITDQMVCIGACWFLERGRFWELGGMDEAHGSWGQMGVELACKSWLSGGRQVVNKKTWFAHLPRTRPGFGFPYDNPGSAQEKARKYSRDLWLNNKWDKAKYPLRWLIDRFSPLYSWEDYEWQH